MEVLDFIFFVLLLGILFYSGGLLVRSLTVLGRYMQLSEYVVSFILVAFATSLPEFFVGINSALSGASLLSLGNIVGANMLNISLVLGLAIIFAKGLDTSKTIEKEDMVFGFVIMVAPVLMAFDGIISRIDGLVLLTGFIFYIIYLLKTEHKKSVFNEIRPSDAMRINPLKHFFLFLIAAALLLASSSFVVSYAVELASYWALPLFVVGILVSFGTTLPEVVFSFKSVSLEHGSMSLGNVFGSIVVNISLILGLAALINPIIIENLPRTIIGLSLTAMMAVIIQIYSFKNSRLKPWLGFALVFMALAFVVVEALIK